MVKLYLCWWLVKKVLIWLFFIVVVVLLVVYVKKVDWGDVWIVICDYNCMVFLSVVGLVIVSYFLYGCYDLFGWFYCGYKLVK